MPRLPLILRLLAAGLLLSAGCIDPRDLPESAEETCTGCHGQGDEPAPPPGIWTRTDGGVGAHQAHLQATSGLAAKISCETCHVVPERATDEGHMDTDLPAEVTLAGLAAGPDKQVKVKYSKGTCTVYCHGATLSGGSLTVPQWEKGSSQAKCGTCHGLPPKDGHPASTSCSGCHDKVVDSANKIKAPALHINGKVESSAACNSCHGSKASPAPPVDTKGNSDTSSRGVGAHQAHVRSGANHIALPCSECHVLPKSLTDKGHNNGTAEVVFGKLAKGELRTTPPGLKPSWDTTGLTCKSTYCHELDGGGNPAPAWTKGQKMVCGSCHGLPPAKTLEGKTHVASSLAQCTTCHSSVVDAAGKITAPKLHVNGKVDQ